MFFIINDARALMMVEDLTLNRKYNSFWTPWKKKKMNSEFNWLLQMLVVIKILWHHRVTHFSIKHAFLQAKWEMHGLKMQLSPWLWLAAEVSNALARPKRHRGYHFNVRVSFVVNIWRWEIFFQNARCPKFSAFSGQNSDWRSNCKKFSKKLKLKAGREQLNGVQKRLKKWFKKRKITVDLKTVSPTHLSEILLKFFG